MTMARMNTGDRKHLLCASLMGSCLNIAGYGFTYRTAGNQPYELAMLNWLRDPGLYPGDPIRQGFARFPTVFWRFLALLPPGLNTELTLFILFLLTKLLFFYGLARILFWASSDWRFTRVAVVLLALSSVLNVRTLIGATFILDRVETHTPLAIAFLICATAWLLEGRWIAPAIL